MRVVRNPRYGMRAMFAVLSGFPISTCHSREGHSVPCWHYLLEDKNYEKTPFLKTAVSAETKGATLFFEQAHFPFSLCTATYSHNNSPVPKWIQFLHKENSIPRMCRLLQVRIRAECEKKKNQKKDGKKQYS